MTIAAEVAGFDIDSSVIMLGAITGMIYGILAVGLVLVFRASKIINFAHGDIGAFGAVLLGVAVIDWGLPYWLAFLLAIAVAAGLGAAAEALVVRRLRNAPVIMSVMATLGLGQFLAVFSAVINSAAGTGKVFPQPPGLPTFELGALVITPAYSAMLFLTPLLVAGLVVFLRRGRLGVAMRASAANADAARMAGILTGRMSMLSWAIAGGVAAFTAALVLPSRGFTNTQFLGAGLLLRGLACAVIGRMVSLPVALAAGIGLGVTEQLLLANYPSGGLVEATMFLIVLGALLLQPARSGRGEDKGSWAAVEPFRPLPDSFRQVASIRNLGLALAGLAIAAALLVLVFVSNATAVSLTVIAAFTTVGLSVGVVTGLGGQLSLGQFALGGVGATASYVLTSHGVTFPVALVGAGLAAAGVSLVIGLPALRIRGLMLGVTTLGFALAAQDWLFQQSWMLGPGVTPERPSIAGIDFDGGKSYFLVALAVLVFAFWLARNVWRSGIGRRLRAVRDNEDTARAFTVRATVVKLQAFVLGGFLAGIGGAVFGHLLARLGSTAFPIDGSINAAAVAVIGGIGTLAGPLLGSLYIIGIPDFVDLDSAGLAATSFGWLLLILYAPGGIAQAMQPWRDRLVDALARRAGLDPAVERRSVPDRAADGEIHSVLLERNHAARSASIETGAVLLEAVGLTRRFGGVVAVRDVDLIVRAGETLGLIGPNGAGKTTLFEVLSGFVPADRGRIVFRGTDITMLTPEQRGRRGLIRSFQDAALFPTMNVLEVVMVALERVDPTPFGRALLGSTASDRRKALRAAELLDVMGLGPFRDTPVRALSTGTRRIAELASLVALEPTLLLLDEPTSGIAQRETEELGAVLERIKASLGLTLVVIEHDIPLIMGMADRIVAMESGAILAEGAPAEVRANPRVIESYLGGDVRAIERSGLVNQ